MDGLIIGGAHLPSKRLDELRKPKNPVSENDLPVIDYDELSRVVSALERVKVREPIPGKESMGSVEFP